MRLTAWLPLALCAQLAFGCALGHSPDLPSGIGDGDGNFGGDGDGDNDAGVGDSADIDVDNPASGGNLGEGGESAQCDDRSMGGMGGDPASEHDGTVFSQESCAQ